MPRLLLLLPPGTYRGEAFKKAAQKLRLDVTIGSDRGTFMKREQWPNYLFLDFRDLEASAGSAVDFAEQYHLDGVIGVDDVTAEVAAVLAQRLGLPQNTPAAVAAARNKYRMRQLLRARNVQIPSFTLFNIEQDPWDVANRIPFPCVVKPTILSASCGVIRADNPETFVTAFHRVAALLKTLGGGTLGDQGRNILMEEFVPGPEVALEGLLTKGQLRLLAIFDKPNPLEGPYFEETIYVTPSRLPQEAQDRIFSCAEAATKALGLKEGPVHGEFRINKRGVWVIEMAPRSIGGRCSQTLRFSSDMSLEELILRHLLGMEIPSFDRQGTASGVMMLPIPISGTFKEIQGQTEARAVPGIEELTIMAEPGDILVPLPEGTRYLGFLFARRETTDAVEAALREAHGYLNVIISGNHGSYPSQRNPGPRSRAISF